MDMDMVSTLRSMGGFPLAVRLLLVNQLGVNTGFYMLVPYLATHLTGNIGLSVAAVGIVLGVRNLSQQGLFLIGGAASDRLGPRGVIIAGCALRSVGFGLFAVGESLPLLLAASVLSGLAGALFNPAVRAYIAVESDEGRRAEAFALFNVFAQAGALLGPVIGSVLLLVDFRVAAVTAALIFAVLTVAQALVLPARPAPPSSDSVMGSFRRSLSDRRFLAFTCALTGMFTLQNQLYLVLPLEAERLTGVPGTVAAVFLVSTIASLLLQVPLTRYFTKATTSGRAIAVGLTVMGAGFAAPALAYLWQPSGPAPVRLLPVLVAALLLSVGVMIAHPFVYELISDFGPSGLTGIYFGMFYLVSGVVSALGNVVIGWTSQVGGQATGWLASSLCAALGLACAVAVALLERRGMLRPSTATDRLDGVTP